MTARSESVIADIVARTRQRLRERPPNVAVLEAASARRPPGPDAIAALQAPGIRIIAEVKRRSPSRGALAPEADAVKCARVYAAAGAAAISVLTEPERFGGSFEDLDAVSRAVAVPTLCKDFIVDPRQVLSARAHGASLVLLIAAVLTDDQLVALREAAEALHMQALVEIHDGPEARRALGSGARLVGVNSRDLRTLEIDLRVAEALRGELPDEVLPIAESGIAGPTEIARLQRAGYRRFLAGSSLMTASDPGALLAVMIAGKDLT